MNRRAVPRDVAGILGLLTLLVVGQSPRSAELRNGDEFRGSLDPSIVLVESGGFWEHEGRVGNFRVVVTKACSPEHCFDRLYLQWLEDKSRERESTQVIEARTVRVSEAGDLTVVRSVHCLAGRDKNVFQVKVANTYTEATRSFCLIAQTIPGRYQVREGKCE